MTDLVECCAGIQKAVGSIRVAIEKAQGDPGILTTTWLVRNETSLGAILQGIIQGAGAENFDAIEAAMNAWTEATDMDALSALVGREVLEVGVLADPLIAGELRPRAVSIVTRSKKATKDKFKFKFKPSAARFGPADNSAAQFMANSQGFFVRNAQGKISKTLSTRTQTIVTRGLERGLGVEEIRDELNRKITGFAKRSGYARTVANSFLNRARVFGSLSTYKSAGVERYIFDAVLDEATTNICFAPWTPIAMANGLDREIEAVQPGDMVMGRDGQPHRVLAHSVRSASEWIRLHMSNGRVMMVTPNHPIYVNGALERADGIKPGDRLRGLRTEDVGISRREDSEILLAGVLPGDKDQGRMDDQEMRSMRGDVQGKDDLHEEGAGEVLHRGVQAEGKAPGGRCVRSKAGLRDVPDGVPYIASGGDREEDPAALLEEVPATSSEALVRDMRGRVQEDEIGSRHCTVLLQEMLPAVGIADPPGGGGGGDPDGVGDPLRVGDASGSVCGGLSAPGLRDRSGGGRALLAHQGSDGQRRVNPSGRVHRAQNSGSRVAPRRPYRGGSIDPFVCRVELIQFVLPSHNLEVEGDPVYFAEGVLVHNCRMMDGKSFTVDSALNKFDRQQEGELGDAQTILPYVVEKKDDEGNVTLEVEGADGVFRTIADVERSATGTADATGTFNQRISDTGLQRSGIQIPPIHQNCRSTTQPDI